jgi:hypothetical protein
LTWAFSEDWNKAITAEGLLEIELRGWYGDGIEDFLDEIDG